MKKLTLFVLILAVSLLTACGNSKKEEKNTEESKTDADTAEPAGDSDTPSAETQDSDDPEVVPDEENNNDPCDPNPCAGLENSTEECLLSEQSGYTCGCKEGFEWNINRCETVLPECSKESKTPCKDSSSNLIWSAISQKEMNWNKAVEYCDKLDEGGYTDWSLPTLTMLRTLIVECENTVLDGKCKVEDLCPYASGCFTNPDNCTCPFESDGKYSKFGDDAILWSGIPVTDYTKKSWIVMFTNGAINIGDQDGNGNFVRCVRYPTQTNDCEKLPENAVWYSNSETNQVWNGKEWYPFTEGYYYEPLESNKDSFKNECNYVCADGYERNNDVEKCLSLKDPETDLIWSKKTGVMTWGEAVSYCNDMNKDGENIWHLPTISELRTLVRNCEGTVFGGSCGIDDDCLNDARCNQGGHCEECSEKANEIGYYSKFFEFDDLWSSSEVGDEENSAWYIDFWNANLKFKQEDETSSTRCVKGKLK